AATVSSAAQRLPNMSVLTSASCRSASTDMTQQEICMRQTSKILTLAAAAALACGGGFALAQTGGAGGTGSAGTAGGTGSAGTAGTSGTSGTSGTGSTSRATGAGTRSGSGTRTAAGLGATGSRRG